MKINKIKEIKSYIDNLINMYEQNINSTDIINTYLENIDEEININKLMNKYKAKEETALYLNMLNLLSVDKNDRYLNSLEKDNKINKIKKLYKKDYINNPYLKNINISDIKSANWSFYNNKYNPYELFLFDEIKVDENNYYAEINTLAYFDELFSYLSIIQDDVIWMLISPHEISTMEKAIKEVKGKVLVYGLGLGYFPYMISLKDDVKEITIIEQDKKAIDLFNKHILNQFENKDKIKIVNDDAFTYSKNNLASLDYNYAFFDIYHNVDDGLPYYKEMLSLEKYNKNIEFIYWIEKSLICALRRALIILLEEEYNDSSDNNYKNSKDEFDKLINELHFKLKDYSINNVNDIKTLLKDENIKNLFR